jgi:exonuclease SbcD
MKLLHTADIHLGMENYGRLDPATGLSTRLGDFLRAFDLIIETALREKVDFFIFSGDAFKTREPTQTQQREFAKRIKMLTSAGIPVVLLVGNHDTSNATGKANSLDIYDILQLEGIHVLRDLGKIEIAGLQIVGLPWLSRAEFATAPAKLKKLLDSLDPDQPALAMVHASVSGASFGSERTVMIGGDLVVDKKVLDHPKLAYVALGHIHQRQIIPGTKVPMVYPGSIERIDFGEAKEDKGFEIVDLAKVGGRWVAKNTHYSTNPRPFVNIRVNLKEGSDPTEQVISHIAKATIKDAVVKVVVSVPPSVNSDFDITRLREALKPAFFVSPISRNIERVTRQTLGEAAAELAPLEALEKYFVSKKVNRGRARELASLAEGLLAED